MFRSVVVLTLCAVLCPWMSAVFAQDHEHEHEAVEKRIPAKYMSYRGAPWLERKTRIQEEEPFKVIEAMKLEKGQTVVDLGVGSGFFARKIARVVGDKGVVYGVDIQREMLDILSKLCEDEGVNNVKPVLGTVTSTTLPDECADWIILADVYHEFSEHEAMLADMMRILKPGGKVALLEYRLEDDSGAHIKTDHRMSVKQVKAEWLPAGFKLVEILEFLKSQHLFIFQKEVEKK